MLLQLYRQYGVSYYCRLFGKTRQAFYEQQNKPNNEGLQTAMILKLVQEIRNDLPRCGTEKLLHLLQPKFNEHQIKIGRDGLYRLLGEHGYLIRFRKRKPYTTNSNHPYKKYPNLIRKLIITRAGKLWVSDITYIRLTNGFAYLCIITDAYSHKIVGYKLHWNLAAQGAIDALHIAAKDERITSELIHHSDRGIQYCCQDYVQEIKRYKIQLSMTENGDPYENPVAERINGILKHEHGLNATFTNYQAAKTAVDLAVKNYNELRPHNSCNRLTPIAAHELQGMLKKHWRPKKYAKRTHHEEEPIPI